jgi:hypothetical protein
MRVSGERQRNRRKASPENLASAMNEGSPASARISAAHGENAASSAAKLTSEMRVLDQREGPTDQAQRAARGLAAGAGELVIELGVLEVTEVEGQRLLEDHHVDAVTELRAQQRLDHADAALHREQHGDQHRLGADQAEHRARVAGRGPRLVHDGVDDQLAEVGDAGRQQAADQGHQREQERQRSARRPHEVEGATTVAKHAEEAAQAGRIVVCRRRVVGVGHARQGARLAGRSDKIIARARRAWSSSCAAAPG